MAALLYVHLICPRPHHLLSTASWSISLNHELTHPQLLLHLLLSIHPTYRARTSPLSLLPETWRSSAVSGKYGLPREPWLPVSAVPELSGTTRPFADDLQVDDNRRKANAAFVVLGGSGSWT
jgi:hypothetical protein